LKNNGNQESQLWYLEGLDKNIFMNFLLVKYFFLNYRESTHACIKIH
jgi:hypothetical protein